MPGHRRLALTNRNEQKLKENLRVRVPGQRRLAISRLRVPNLDGVVRTAAGNLLSIGAPCHRYHTVTQKVSTRIKRGREKVYRKKLTSSSARSPGTRKRTFGNLLHLCLFQACSYQQKVTYSSDLSYRHSKKEHVFFVIVLAYSQKKTYRPKCPVRVDSTNPVRASQTTTRHPSARASLDPSGEKATALI